MTLARRARELTLRGSLSNPLGREPVTLSEALSVGPIVCPVVRPCPSVLDDIRNLAFLVDDGRTFSFDSYLSLLVT